MKNIKYINFNMVVTWYKDIKKPWLDMLESGVKEYEGRLVRKDWCNMKRDDIIIFNDGSKSLSFKILGFVYAANFKELYSKLGSKLVPYMPDSQMQSNLTPDIVEIIYEKLLGLSFEQIEKYGVMGIKLQLI